MGFLITGKGFDLDMDTIRLSVLYQWWHSE